MSMMEFLMRLLLLAEVVLLLFLVDDSSAFASTKPTPSSSSSSKAVSSEPPKRRRHEIIDRKVNASRTQFDTSDRPDSNSNNDNVVAKVTTVNEYQFAREIRQNRLKRRPHPSHQATTTTTTTARKDGSHHKNQQQSSSLLGDIHRIQWDDLADNTKSVKIDHHMKNSNQRAPVVSKPITKTKKKKKTVASATQSSTKTTNSKSKRGRPMSAKTAAEGSRRVKDKSSNGRWIPYNETFEALKVYHEEHGHIILPRRYVVPAESSADTTINATSSSPSSTDSSASSSSNRSKTRYPPIWHGVDLAGTVYDMQWWQTHIKHRPDRVAQLNTLGFVWERLQPEWNLILEALIVYRGLYDDLLVNANFIVPYNDDRWPKACWGLALGNVVKRIRNRADHLRDHHAYERREQLDSIGFCWDLSEVRFNKFCYALRVYRQIYSPDGHEYPVRRHSTKTTTINPNQMDISTALAPTYTPSNLIGSGGSLEGLTISSGSSGGMIRTFGSSETTFVDTAHLLPVKIPYSFKIPRSSRWPNALWGYPLGEKCVHIRQKQLYIKNHPERIDQLANLGFFVEGTNGSNKGLSWLKLVHASAVYSQLHNNTLDPQVAFVVPSPPGTASYSTTTTTKKTSKTQGSDDAWPWPEYLWEYPLGRRLRDVRLRGYHVNGRDGPVRRKQLDALGMKWKKSRGWPSGKPRKEISDTGI